MHSDLLHRSSFWHASLLLLEQVPLVFRLKWRHVFGDAESYVHVHMRVDHLQRDMER